MVPSMAFSGGAVGRQQIDWCQQVVVEELLISCERCSSSILSTSWPPIYVILGHKSCISQYRLDDCFSSRLFLDKAFPFAFGECRGRMRSYHFAKLFCVALNMAISRESFELEDLTCNLS